MLAAYSGLLLILTPHLTHLCCPTSHQDEASTRHQGYNQARDLEIFDPSHFLGVCRASSRNTNVSSSSILPLVLIYLVWPLKTSGEASLTSAVALKKSPQPLASCI